MVAPTAFFTLIEHYKSIVILSGSEESFFGRQVAAPTFVQDDNIKTSF